VEERVMDEKKLDLNQPIRWKCVNCGNKYLLNLRQVYNLPPGIKTLEVQPQVGDRVEFLDQSGYSKCECGSKFIELIEIPK